MAHMADLQDSRAQFEKMRKSVQMGGSAAPAKPKSQKQRVKLKAEQIQFFNPETEKWVSM